MSNAQTNQVFEDLSNYLTFCKEYGYVFRENELYSMRSNAWRQFQRFVSGKSVRDQWEIDYVKYKDRELLGNSNYRSYNR